MGDAFKVSVGSEVVDSTCVYSMVEFRNDVSFVCVLFAKCLIE